jgi:putative methyltransferase
MNFYFEAASVLERIESKRGSIKGILGSLPEKDRRRTSALVIETLKCACCPMQKKSHLTCTRQTDKAVLTEVINSAKLLQQERQKITSFNLALLLVHDLLFSKGIQAGDGPIKQAVLRHKTRLHGELQKLKIKKGVKNNAELAQSGDPRASE